MQLQNNKLSEINFLAVCYLTMKHFLKKTVVLLLVIIISVIVIFYINNLSEPVFSAKCIKVLDASRIVVWLDSQWFSNRMKLRLHGIKCPDRKTDVGKLAWSLVKSQISGKTIDIKIVQRQIMGWSTAIVYYNDICLNEMVESICQNR